MNSNGQVEKVGVCHITKWMKVIFLISWLLVLGGNALAQLSDLRYSRKPLPGVSDIAEVGIVVDMGLAQDLMQPAAIVETLRPRLETLGYRVALAPTHSPDGLWVQVDCQDLPKKIDPRSSRASQQATGKNQRLVPPCQLAYGYQHEVIPWKNVDRLIYSESVSTMQKIAQRSRPLQPQECVEQFFSMYDFPVLLAAEWGHGDRLLQVLNRPDTPVSRQRLILTLLGETHVTCGKITRPSPCQGSSRGFRVFWSSGTKAFTPYPKRSFKSTTSGGCRQRFRENCCGHRE
jgi:hypothetical protein